MLALLQRLTGLGDPAREAAADLLGVVSREALSPERFARLGFADTFDGRFEALAVTSILALRRLRAEGPRAERLSEAFTTRLFRALDDALRDLGTGDTTIARKIRKMGEAFYGRARAYEAALNAADAQALAVALARNIADDEDTARWQVLADWMVAAEAALTAQTVEAMVAGEGWPA
jgi:cytochrome b pre-mRNA-processing protein 3